DLKEVHVAMMAFSTCVGVGLFLQGGRAIYLAGPGLAFIAYIIGGSIEWATMASLGEMTALFPIEGPIFAFTCHFLDQGLGYAAGWLICFSWTIVVAAEILAITQLFKFRFDPHYLQKLQYPDPSLGWKVGQETSPAIWCVIFMAIILAVNFLPIRRYGQVEYCVGTIKILFFVLLIMFNIVLSGLQLVPRGGRFWTYNAPYGFAVQNYTIPLATAKFPYEGNYARKVITGDAGRLAGMWSAITTTIFSMTGFETVAISAAENRDLRRSEAIKLATRKTGIRVVILYTLAIATVGLNVPYTDPYLRDMSINSINFGQDSPFILSAVYNHLRGWPHFFNAFYIFSATTCGINALYNASRTLHAMARIKEAWPSWGPVQSGRERLERTHAGIPFVAITTCWLFSFLAFLATKPFPAKVLGRIATNSVASHLVVNIVICLTYLRFYKRIKLAAGGQDPTVDQHLARAFDRDNRRYPYKSRGQYMRALYALFGSLLVCLFNGWRSFVSPMSIPDILVAYISVRSPQSHSFCSATPL
ncbi:uncharacterized protein BDR25DRAFT_238012, partial [Lindgomyces ingoldianus]